MAVGNQHSIQTGIDHERLSKMRDIEFPNTVPKYLRKASEIKEDTKKSSFGVRRVRSTNRTQFYDKNLRRI